MMKQSFNGFWMSVMQLSRQLFMDVTYCKNAKIRYSAATETTVEANHHWTLMVRSLKKAIYCMAKAANIRDLQVGPRIAIVNFWIKMAGIWAKDARVSATEAMAVIDPDGHHTLGAAAAAAAGQQQPERLQPSSLDSLATNEGVTKRTRAITMFGEFSHKSFPNVSARQ